MSPPFDLDEGGQRALFEKAHSNPIDATRVGAGFFENWSVGTYNGVMRGGARLAQSVAIMVSAPLVLWENRSMAESPETPTPPPDHSMTDKYFGWVDENFSSAVDFWTPNAQEVGALGQTLGSVAEIVLPLMVSAGNPILLIATQQIGTSVELVRRGVDAETALAVGTLKGMATAVGFTIPNSVGYTLGQRAFSGAAGNLVVGTTERVASAALLKDHPELSDAYGNSIEASMIDTLSGALFGVGAHYFGRVKPRQIDDLLTARNAKHFQQDTAPGIPANAWSSASHQNALEMAIAQLMRGERVNVGDAVRAAHFVRFGEEMPLWRALQSFAEWFKPREMRNRNPVDGAPSSETIRKQIVISESMAPEMKRVAERFRDEVANDLEGAITRYSSVEGSDGGRVIGTDLVRELCADYVIGRDSRTRLTEATTPTAEFLSDILYRRRLEQPDLEGHPTVAITAGGPGSGKTTGLSESNLKPQIHLDMTLSNFDQAVRRINAALEAGKKVLIYYTARDPVVAMIEGVVPRALDERNGRIVTLQSHAAKHRGANKTVRALLKKYGADARVGFEFTDNRYGFGEHRKATAEILDELNYDNLEQRLEEALNNGYRLGEIPKDVYEGILGTSVQGGGGVFR
ncbi:MAG: zeta toxin family protein [Candidatus Accumulibacter sp.]|jgi:hypothetical protein|nr:zeta toxin family protein [Accumulibacter sp.]